MSWAWALPGLLDLGGDLLGGVLSSKDRKLARNATKQQMAISQMMADLAKRQADMELPFKENLYGSLTERMQRKTPRFLPRKTPIVNPFQNTRKMVPAAMRAGAEGNPTRPRFNNPLVQQMQGQMQNQLAASGGSVDPRMGGGMANPMKPQFIDFLKQIEALKNLSPSSATTMMAPSQATRTAGGQRPWTLPPGTFPANPDGSPLFTHDPSLNQHPK